MHHAGLAGISQPGGTAVFKPVSLAQQQQAGQPVTVVHTVGMAQAGQPVNPQTVVLAPVSSITAVLSSIKPGTIQISPTFVLVG